MIKAANQRVKTYIRSSATKTISDVPKKWMQRIADAQLVRIFLSITSISNVGSCGVTLLFLFRAVAMRVSKWSGSNERGINAAGNHNPGEFAR